MCSSTIDEESQSHHEWASVVFVYYGRLTDGLGSFTESQPHLSSHHWLPKPLPKELASQPYRTFPFCSDTCRYTRLAAISPVPKYSKVI